MATFEVRVEGNTGIAISSSGTNPTQAEVTEYLKDGVNEVTSRVTLLRPQDSYMFIRGSSASDSQGALSSDTGKLLSVVRESGTNDDWRDCRR